MTGTLKPVGNVFLISGGAGDPALLTARAAAAAAQAEVCVADPGVEHLLPEDVEDLGVDPTDSTAVVDALVLASRSGRLAVRAYAGDPVMDGRAMADAAALAQAGVSFELTVSVGDVSAVAAYAGITLTSAQCREVRILDAHAGDLDASVLADDAAMVVVRNGADQAGLIAKASMAAGRDGGTPMAVVVAGCTVEQQTVVTTLATAAADLKAARIAGSGMVFIGEGATTAGDLGWFEAQPLFGWRVLVPRTKDQAGALSAALRRYGAVPVEVPTISVEPPRTPQQMERAIEGIEAGRYQWIAFTSVNAVRAIRERLERRGLDARHLAGLKVAAIGQTTAAALLDFGVRADLVPDPGSQSSVGLLDVWPERDRDLDPIGRVFLPRADIATETLVEGLRQLGWEVDDITAYRTVRAAPPAAPIRESIKTGGFDAVVFTSSSTVRNLVGIAGKPHASTVVAAIGPETAKAAREHGLTVAVEPEQSTIESLVVALAGHGGSLRRSAIEAGEPTWRPSRRRSAGRRRAPK